MQAKTNGIKQRKGVKWKLFPSYSLESILKSSKMKSSTRTLRVSEGLLLRHLQNYQEMLLPMALKEKALQWVYDATLKPTKPPYLANLSTIIFTQ